MRLVVVLPVFFAILLAFPALAEDAPLPRPRPTEADKKSPQSVQIDPAEIEADKKICEDFFKADFAVAMPENPMAWDNGCRAAAPVRMVAIKLKNGKTVELIPAAILRCTMAQTIANWVRDDLSSAAHNLGTELQRINVAASYACRPRNSVLGAVLSEHGKANAFDIRSLQFADGRTVIIENGNGPQGFLSAMRKSACDRFTTVLGPSSDSAHESHLHVDLAERLNNYKMCQWILPKPENTASFHEQGSEEDRKTDRHKFEKKK
jgi:hypothetical protein